MSMKEHMTASWTILYREFLRAMAIWKQTIITPLITTTLYFIIFGSFVGSRVPAIQGYSYMEFIVPGLIMMPLITGAFMHVVFAIYLQRFIRSIEDLVVSPIPPVWMLFGFVVSGIGRAVVVGIVTWLVSLLFVPFHMHSVFLVLSFVILTCTVFSLVGFTAGLFARSFDDANTIPTFVLTPLTFLGGVFYSLDALPAVWQTISKLNPILYMINGLRYGFLGISDVNVYFSAGMLIVLIIALSWFNIYLIKKGQGLRT